MSSYRPMIERFWEKVHKTDGCWLWTASLDNHGYGQIQRSREQHPIRAHIYSYELHYGSIPAGLCVCHRCDIPACIRPDHLFLGTHTDNLKDSASKGRMHRGERTGNAKLTNKEVIEIKSLLANHVPQKVIAKKFKVSHANICAINTGYSWSWLKLKEEEPCF